jgi:hypothetical protein
LEKKSVLYVYNNLKKMIKLLEQLVNIIFIKNVLKIGTNLILLALIVEKILKLHYKMRIIIINLKVKKKKFKNQKNY